MTGNLKNIAQYLNSIRTSEVSHSYPSATFPKHQLAREAAALTASSVFLGQSPPVPDKLGSQIKTE